MTKHYSNWRKSRLSNPNGECVEVARADDGTIGVRDSKAHGSFLEFTRQEWTAFISATRDATPSARQGRDFK